MSNFIENIYNDGGVFLSYINSSGRLECMYYKDGDLNDETLLTSDRIFDEVQGRSRYHFKLINVGKTHSKSWSYDSKKYSIAIDWRGKNGVNGKYITRGLKTIPTLLNNMVVVTTHKGYMNDYNVSSLPNFTDVTYSQSSRTNIVLWNTPGTYESYSHCGTMTRVQSYKNDKVLTMESLKNWYSDKREYYLTSNKTRYNFFKIGRKYAKQGLFNSLVYDNKNLVLNMDNQSNYDHINEYMEKDPKKPLYNDIDLYVNDSSGDLVKYTGPNIKTRQERDGSTKTNYFFEWDADHYENITGIKVEFPLSITWKLKMNVKGETFKDSSPSERVKDFKFTNFDDVNNTTIFTFITSIPEIKTDSGTLVKGYQSSNRYKYTLSDKTNFDHSELRVRPNNRGSELVYDNFKENTVYSFNLDEFRKYAGSRLFVRSFFNGMGSTQKNDSDYLCYVPNNYFDIRNVNLSLSGWKTTGSGTATEAYTSTYVETDDEDVEINNVNKYFISLSGVNASCNFTLGSNTIDLLGFKRDYVPKPSGIWFYYVSEELLSDSTVGPTLLKVSNNYLEPDRDTPQENENFPNYDSDDAYRVENILNNLSSYPAGSISGIYKDFVAGTEPPDSFNIPEQYNMTISGIPDGNLAFFILIKDPASNYTNYCITNPDLYFECPHTGNTEYLNA